MNETASTKPRVTILSDIVLNPYRDIPQSENPPASSPPLAPLSNQNQIVLGITNGPNISDSSESTNKQTVPSTPDTEITKIHTIDASLKRKSVDIDIAYRETPKKPKLKAINVQSPIRDQVDLNEEDGEETVFNYMTGAYETVTRVETPKSLESAKKDDDIKNEITIQENVLKDEDTSPKIEAEDLKIDDTKQEIESVTRSKQEQVPALDDKKSTVTIDLTDDDDNVPNIGVQNNVFIDNVRALQNAIALQNGAKSLDSKTLLHNSFVIQNHNSPSTNLQGDRMMKNPNLILQNSAKISTRDTSNIVTAAGTFTSPTVFVVQNNSTFLVPQNLTSPNKPVHNNVQQNLVSFPNNSIQRKQSSSVPNIVQTNLSPGKNVENFALKNNSVNLGVKTKTDQISLKSFTIVSPVQIKEKFWSSSLDKTATDNSAHNSTHSPQNLTNSPQNLKKPIISSQTHTKASQNFTCATCAHKACSKRDLMLHIYNAHLKNDYELKLKCKMCDFETNSLNNMEKHDFDHGCNPKNQEKLDDVGLSSNIEIQIRPKKKDNDSVIPSFVPTIDLSDSEDPISKKTPYGVMIFRCFECNFISFRRPDLKSHAVKHMPSQFRCPKHSTIRETCSECEYKKCLFELEKSTRSNNKNYEIFKCFHCFHVAKSLRLLKDHAVRHFGGGFKCDIHKSVNSATCNKCIYEMVLRDLKYVVNACSCGYKTLSKDYYLKHRSTEKNCEAFRKTIGNYVESSSGVLAEIEKEFQKSQKARGSNRRLPDIGRNVSRNSGVGKGNASRIQVLSSDSEVEEVSGDFRCFHCTYATTSRDLLKFHAVKHYQCAFQCNSHPTLRGDACDQCLYSVILEELGKEVLLCLKCGFRTLRQPTFDRHKSRKENCENFRKSRAVDLENPVESESDTETRSTKSSKGSLSSAATQERNSPVLRPEVLICATCNYRATDKDTFKLHEKIHENPSSKPKPLLNCFDCNEFCTEDREELKEHAVLHYKKNFSCQKHCPTENAQNCGKCIYLSIKKDMEKEIMICKKCSFKTLRPDLFEQHKSSENLCRTSTKDNDDDYVPESDADSGKESGEENPRRKLEHLSASNGDTVARKKTFYKFECFDCGLRYVNRSELEMHVVAHPDSSFRCDHFALDELCKKCIYQFILETTSAKKMQSCKSCSYKCNDLEAMQNHIKSHVHCENVNEIVNSLVSNNPPSGLKSCQCYDCGMEFDSRAKLWTHATCHKSDFRCLEHEGNTRNDCNKCLYSFIQKNIRPYYFKCVECPNRSYFSELDLKGHIELAHEGSKFKCDEHRVPLPKTCEKCRQVYMVERTSKKIKYICVDCKNNLPFPTWRSLKDHISYCHAHSGTKCLNHTTIKQYLKCDACLFEKILLYLQSQGLKNGYQCFECPMKLFTRESLEVHVRIMHEDSTFHCTTHSLGDIDDQCGMCVYESIVVLMNS